MLYKHLFSILCGHLNLKKNKFVRLPVKPASKPVKPAGIPVRTGWTAPFEFKFEFHRFRPVTGQTGPVYQYRNPAVTGDRSEIKTLLLLKSIRLRKPCSMLEFVYCACTFSYTINGNCISIEGYNPTSIRTSIIRIHKQIV